MFNLLVPGELCAFVHWTGRSVSINKRNMIGSKWTVKAGRKRKIPIIVKAPDYQKFCESVIDIFLSQWKNKTISHGVFMVYYIGPHYLKGKMKDADAFHKPIQDGLEHAGILDDDKLILSYAMIPMEPNDSMDFVRVELFRMNTIHDLKIISQKDAYEGI